MSASPVVLDNDQSMSPVVSTPTGSPVAPAQPMQPVQPVQSRQPGQSVQSAQPAAPNRSAGTWQGRCGEISQQYRQHQQEMSNVQRVQARCVIDRWMVQGVSLTRGSSSAKEETPTQLWSSYSLRTLPLVEQNLAEFLDPTVRDALIERLTQLVHKVTEQPLPEQPRRSVVWEIAVPAALSLAAGMGLVRGVVAIMEFTGQQVMGWWWLLAAAVLGIAFCAGMTAVRIHTYRQQTRHLTAAGLHQELDRQLTELFATVFYLGSDNETVDPHSSASPPRRVQALQAR